MQNHPYNPLKDQELLLLPTNPTKGLKKKKKKSTLLCLSLSLYLLYIVSYKN